MVYYHLGDEDEVTLEFLDTTGEVIRRASSVEGDEDDRLSTEAGMNRFVWDLRYPGADVIDGSFFFGSARGPKVVPATIRSGSASAHGPRRVRSRS